MADEEKTYGQVAYEAFQFNQRRRLTGEAIPQWGELSQDVQNDWHFVAAAVGEEIENDLGGWSDPYEGPSPQQTAAVQRRMVKP